MKVKYKNKGTYPGWSLDGAVLSLRGSALTLDLAALAQDEPAHIIVSEDQDGAFVLGPSRRYVAELDLPARRYVIEKIGFVDDFGFPALRRTVLPFSAEDAVLTLWAEKEGGR